MIKSALVSTLVSLTLLGATVVSAQEPAPPKPAPELEKNMKYFEGSWKCDGKMEAGMMGPGSPALAYKSTLKFKKGLGGFWYAGEYEMKGGKGMPAMKAMFNVGFDPTTKHMVGLGIDNMGGWRTDNSNGWEGDKLVVNYDGLMMGQKMQGRENMTKKSDKEFVNVMEVKAGADFKKMSEEHCKK